jgi:glycine cleavage system H protein
LTAPNLYAIGPYTLAEDLYYDPDTHLWIAPPGADDSDGAGARCGFDPLGSETSGDVVAVSFAPVGTRVARGTAFGSLEAAKFVGPLLAPVSGTVRAHNAAVTARPALLNADPLRHWLVELELDDPAGELPLLLHGREAVASWFAREVSRFEQRGMIAE